LENWHQFYNNQSDKLTALIWLINLQIQIIKDTITLLITLISIYTATSAKIIDLALHLINILLLIQIQNC